MSKLVIKFENNQEHQLKAIESAVKLFNGFSKCDNAFKMYGSDTIANMDPFEMMDEQWLFDNLIQVQKDNGLVEDTYLNFDYGFELLDVDDQEWTQFNSDSRVWKYRPN